MTALSGAGPAWSSALCHAPACPTRAGQGCAFLGVTRRRAWGARCCRVRGREPKPKAR